MEDNKKYLYLYNKNINIKQEKRNNPSCFGRNNACPLSITIKVSNINGWEYR